VYLKLKYFDSETVTAASSTTAIRYIFRGNSIFDPNATNDTTTARGFKDWSAFYSRYQVTASKISIIAHNKTASTGDDLRLSLYCSASNAESTVVDPVTVPGVKTILIPSGSGPTTSKKLKKYMTTAKVYNLPLSSLGFTASSADFQHDPTAQWFWYLQFESAKNDATSIENGYPGFAFYVRITYYVKLFNLNTYGRTAEITPVENMGFEEVYTPTTTTETGNDIPG